MIAEACEAELELELPRIIHDFSEMKEQSAAKRALEVAAAFMARSLSYLAKHV